MATRRDLVRFESNERVDLPDLKAMQRGARSETRALGRAFMLSGNQARVLEGFGVTPDSPASELVTVARGRALAIYGDPETGEYEYGVPMNAEGDTSLTLDFTGKGAGLYGIWVRFDATAAVPGVRIFWNNALPGEESRSIDTRYVIGWSAQIAAVSPGTEWFQVAEIDWDGAAVQSADIDDRRVWYFEGDSNASYVSGWGAGNDRNADRSTYGVTNLRTMINAIKTQIETIVGDSQRWWEDFTRISADKFQIEGAPATRFWDDDGLHHAPAAGDSTIDLIARGSGSGALRANAGADLDLVCDGGGVLTVGATGGSSMIVSVSGGGSYQVQAPNYDVSTGGAVDAVTYGYQSGSEKRIYHVIDLAAKLSLLYDGGHDDPSFLMHDANSLIINTSNFGAITTDLAGRLVWYVDAANWFFLFPIDEYIHNGAVLHSVRVTYWADNTHTANMSVTLRSVARLGAATSYSDVATVTESLTGDEERHVAEFVFDEAVNLSTLYQLYFEEGPTGTTADLEIYDVQLTFDCASVEELSKVV